MLQLRTKAYPIALATLTLGMAVGCENSDRLSRAEVTGTVTLDGKPINTATIIFRPSSGRAGRGIVENGQIVTTATYDLNDGIVLGSHKLAIQPIVADIKPAPSRMDDDPGTETPSKPPSVSRTELPAKPTTSVHIPAKYRHPDRSGLSAEIVAGENQLVLELQSK